MSEAQWQQRITDLCDLLGLRWHHETDSRRSKSGFPDLVIVGPGGVLFVELKSEKGRVSKAQQAWLDSIASAINGYCFVWRPSDWPDAYYALYDLADKTPPKNYVPAA